MQAFMSVMPAVLSALRMVVLLIDLKTGSAQLTQLSLLPHFEPTALAPSFLVWATRQIPPVLDFGVSGGDYQTAPPSTGPSDVFGGSTLRFPLQRTELEATVADGVLHARVRQVYRNDGDLCIHTRYIFPLPHRAAISAMEMRIGDRRVVGQIRQRDEAREEFERAREEGQSASLLDQERPNVFAMELANVLPGETTEVVVDYVERLAPVDGVYAFTFPTVVSPRYGEGWSSGNVETSNLTTQVHLRLPGGSLGVESNLTLVEELGLGTQSYTATAENADVVIKFWFTEQEVGARMFVGSWGSEQFFMFGVLPPQRRMLGPEQISKREFLFILDVSGSMTGYPIDLSKSLMTTLLRDNVRPGDSLNILLFAGAPAVLTEGVSLEVTPEVIDSTLAWLDQNMHGGGGTQLLPALERAFELPRLYADAARTIIVMTDGHVTVEQEAFDLVRRNLGLGNVFVFGIGTSVNRYIIDGLAHVGLGEPFVVTSESDGQRVAAELQRFIDTPVLTRLRLSFEGGSFQPFQLEPPSLPDVFASRPVQVSGKWSGELSGTVRLTGQLPGGEIWEFSEDLAALPLVEAPAAPLLWARARIGTLSDYAGVWAAASFEEEITALGLNFSLLTQHTAFVAVDSQPQAPETCRAPRREAPGQDDAEAADEGLDEAAQEMSMMVSAPGSSRMSGNSDASSSAVGRPWLVLVAVGSWLVSRGL